MGEDAEQGLVARLRAGDRDADPQESRTGRERDETHDRGTDHELHDRLSRTAHARGLLGRQRRTKCLHRRVLIRPAQQRQYEQQRGEHQPGDDEPRPFLDATEDRLRLPQHSEHVEHRVHAVPPTQRFVLPTHRTAPNIRAAMQAFYADHFVLPLPPGHRFPMVKYALLRERVVAAGVVAPADLHVPAPIFADDDTVFTFAIYAAKNFPFEKQPADVAIPLADRTGDTCYLDYLEMGLERAVTGARADLAIYVSGADPYAGDRLGRLALSKEGLADRDRLVFATCRRAGLPVAVTMAGGYGRDVSDPVDRHYRTVQLAAGLDPFPPTGVR